MLGRIRSRILVDRSTLAGRGRHATGRPRRSRLTPVLGDGADTPRREGRTGRRREAALRAASALTAAGVAVGIGTVVADHSSAETAHTRASYAPRVTTGWHNDTTLGRTARTDQYAEARVTGLKDARFGAGFRLRYAHRGSQVLVAVSGTGWLIQPSDGAAMTGAFPHAPSGTLRAEIQGQTVRLRWNGVLVTTRRIAGSYPGRHVVGTVRQPTASVVLRTIRASSLPLADPGTPLPAAFGPGGTWWSGASGDQAANGTYGAWRGTALQMGGTWTDTYSAVTDQWTICRGPWSTWNKPLDLAVGALYHSRGETWAAAARGAYSARWTTSLTKIKTCWGSRDPGLLYLRFAHEMNLASIPWSVRKGEEANFIAAMRLFSDLRYRIIPRANLVLCPNDGTDASLGGLDVRNLWPGRDAQGRPVANVYAVDSYNFWPHATTAAAFTTKINATYSNGAPKGIERHRQFAAQLGVPFAVPEWSNNGDPKASGGGGESPVYVQQFNAWARAHAGDPSAPAPGQFLYEIHFNLWTEYAFWPKTVQPRTAAAYRALPWGR